jgi:hypothetical protein
LDSKFLSALFAFTYQKGGPNEVDSLKNQVMTFETLNIALKFPVITHLQSLVTKQIHHWHSRMIGFSLESTSFLRFRLVNDLKCEIQEVHCKLVLLGQVYFQST